MKYKIYSVFDTKADSYMQPFFMPNDDLAIRGVTTLVREEGHPFMLYPEDYMLVSVGEWDEGSGTIEKTSIIVVCNLSELVEE